MGVSEEAAPFRGIWPENVKMNLSRLGCTTCQTSTGLRRPAVFHKEKET